MASMASYLLKGDADLKHWKRRYFVLKGSMLFYYKDKSDKRPTAEIDVSNSKLRAATSKTANNLYMFELTTVKGTFILAADSAPFMAEWIAALELARGQTRAEVVDLLRGFESLTPEEIEQSIVTVTGEASGGGGRDAVTGKAYIMDDGKFTTPALSMRREEEAQDVGVPFDSLAAKEKKHRKKKSRGRSRSSGNSAGSRGSGG